MPLDGERLIVEPTYPNAEKFMAIGQAEDDQTDDSDDRLINSWHSRKLGCDVLLIQHRGRVVLGKLPAYHHLDQLIRTMGCSAAWGVEQEGRAIQLLGTMLRHRAFKQYLLTGMFLETSARSGVTYLFRKLRPTIAISACAGMPEREMKILAALCMHPIGYYRDSWAGAMCPTDDVIAHLALMRGDEAMFWRRCNQHPAYRPEAGIS